MGLAAVGRYEHGLNAFKSGLKSAGKAIESFPQSVSHGLVDTLERGVSSWDAGVVGMNQAFAKFGGGPGAKSAVQSTTKPAGASKAEPLSSKDNAKAADYMYKMLTCLKFPGEENLKEFRLAVVGDGDLEAQAKKLDGKVVRGKPIRVVRVKNPSELEQKGVKMLLIGPDCASAKEWLEKSPKEGLVTIDSSSATTDLKADARFVKNGDRTEIHVNVDELRQTGVRVSPTFMKGVVKKIYSNSGDG